MPGEQVTKAITETDCACAVRARAWAFAFACYAKKEGGPATAPEDARKDKNAGIHLDCT